MFSFLMSFRSKACSFISSIVALSALVVAVYQTHFSEVLDTKGNEDQVPVRLENFRVRECQLAEQKYDLRLQD